MFKPILIGLAVIVMTVLPISNGICQKYGEITDEEWDFKPPFRYQEANAVILFDRGELELTTDGISLVRHVRIKVFNHAGAEETGDASFTFHDGDKIRSLKAHTITPDGKKHKINRKAFRTQSYGTAKAKTFSFPCVEDGSILEYTYRLFHTRFAYLDPWYFQNPLYTCQSQFVLKLAPGFIYSSVTNNIQGTAQKATKAHDRLTDMTSYTWTMRDLLPSRDEPYAGAVKNYAPALHYQLVSYKDAYQDLTFVKNWSDLGKFFTEEILRDYLKKSGDIDGLVARITEGSTSHEHGAQLIYKWICDSIRTRTDEEGRYLSHDNVAGLLTDRYGTTDEKNVLLAEMCKRAGLTSWTVLISTRDHGLFNPDIYQLQQFNQIVTCIETGSDTVFLDATSQYCPYGILPPRCLVSAGFLLDGESSRVVRLTTEKVRSYRIDNILVQIQSDGVARCSTAISLSGYFTVHYGRKYEETEPEDFVREYFLNNLNCEYELGEYSFEKNDEKNRCQVTFTYTSRDLVQRIDSNLLVKQPLLRFAENPFSAEKRFSPVDFGFPFTQHSIITVRARDSLSSAQLPTNVSEQIDGAEFTRQARSVGSDSVIESRIIISQPFFTTEGYTELKTLFVTIENASAERVILVVH